MTEFLHVDSRKFAVFHTIYTDSGILSRFDWNESVDGAIDGLSDKSGLFMYDDTRLMGGFSLKDNTISYPFVVPPFDDRRAFWHIILHYATRTSGQNEILLREIPESAAHTLTQSCGATLRWSNRRMCRPTELCAYALTDGFCFDSLIEEDKSEIARVVYEAHAAGYTSTVRPPDLNEIEEAVDRRFRLFGQTDTLCMSNLVRDAATREIAGVCIAGIYPGPAHYSTSNFSTIHQVSVKPEYRRKGIARAMICKAINEASAISSVITLGVLIGNPAEILYRDVGFAPGPRYSELVCTL